MSFGLSEVLHTVGQAIKVPCMAVLIIMMLVTVWQIGDVAVEAITERRKRCRDTLGLLKRVHEAGKNGLGGLIEGSGLLRGQRAALKRFVSCAGMSRAELEAAATEIIEAEERRYSRGFAVTDTVARLGPMFGLLGTLIPLGPGIVALGQGDTATLSQSMGIAFDTTIAGVVSAAICGTISGVRKKWYKEYLTTTEDIMDCILEEVSPK